MRHYRIKPADAIEAHKLSLQRGGRAGLARPSELLSAIQRPYSGYHRSINRKAAALMQAVATNHAFVDGNKRTSVLLTVLLIEQSGYTLRPLRKENINDGIEELVVGIVNKEISFDDAVEWFRSRIVRKPG